MKRYRYLGLISLVIPLLFLTGCSHVRKIKIDTNGSQIAVTGNSSKNKVYYRDEGSIKSSSVDESSFRFEVPRKLESRTIEVSGNKNLSSAKKVTIPSSKPLTTWDEYVDEFNSQGFVSATGENKGPKLPSRFSNYTSGTHSTILKDQRITFYLDSGQLMGITVKGNYPVNKFATVVGDAAAGTDIDFYVPQDKAESLSLTGNEKVKGIRTVKGNYEGYRFNGSNIYGQLNFYIYK